jgi:hypothetical protein
VATVDELDELDACVVVAPVPLLVVPLLAVVVAVPLVAVAVVATCVEPHAATIAKSATVPSLVRSR